MKWLSRRLKLTTLLLVASLAMAGCGGDGESGGGDSADSGDDLDAGDSDPTTLEELASYQGEDRAEILEACAEEEGELVWISELAGAVITEMKEAFEEKYPFISVSESRADGRDFIPRMREEREAGRYTVDAFEMSADTHLLLEDLDMRQPYWSPALDAYADDVKEPAGDGLVYRTSDRLSFVGFGYNTDLLDADAVPQTYEDLLDPALEGELVLVGDATGAQVFEVMVESEGEDFPERLGEQNYTVQQVGARALLDLIVAGEVTASPSLFRNHVLAAADDGAPVAFQPLSPVSTSVGGSSVARNAPNPCSALLWTDFILGEEGRVVFDRFHYGDPAADWDFELDFPGEGQTPEEYDQALQTADEAMRANAGGGQ